MKLYNRLPYTLLAVHAYPKKNSWWITIDGFRHDAEMIQEGMGGYSRESGFDRLTVRNLERPNISLRDTRFDRLAPQEAGLA